MKAKPPPFPLRDVLLVIFVERIVIFPFRLPIPIAPPVD